MVLLVKWVLSALAFMLVAYFVSGIEVASFWAAILIALVWGFLSITLKPIMLILTLPINILTLGLFTFVINGLLIWLMGWMLAGFMVDGLWTAIVGGFILTIINLVVNYILYKSFTDK